MKTYALAKQGVFWTVQGEGHFSGLPMVFVRLAGCSVGCPLCDTDYKVDSRKTVDEIVGEAKAVRSGTLWAWVTGGEPTDHELGPLFAGLRREGFMVALATAGVRQPSHRPDWTYVSPHSPDDWVVRWGDEVNIVPGLNGCSLDDFSESAGTAMFKHLWVTPCDGKPETLGECLEWVRKRPGWRLNAQSHKQWGVA